MSLADLNAREHRREQRERNARVALFRKTINTYGLATMGAAIGGSLLDTNEPGLFQALTIMLALALHALAIYLAPVGASEKDDE